MNEYRRQDKIAKEWKAAYLQLFKHRIEKSSLSDLQNSASYQADASGFSADVNAQLQITQAFSQVAPKAVANFADQQQASLEKQAKQLPENDPRKQTLLNEAKQWTEGGSYRIALTPSRAHSGEA